MKIILASGSVLRISCYYIDQGKKFCSKFTSDNIKLILHLRLNKRTASLLPHLKLKTAGWCDMHILITQYKSNFVKVKDNQTRKQFCKQKKVKFQHIRTMVWPVSPPLHYWHLGPDRSLQWEAVLCSAGCLVASLTSTNQVPVTKAAAVVKNKTISRHCQMSPGWQNCHELLTKVTVKKKKKKEKNKKQS